MTTPPTDDVPPERPTQEEIVEHEAAAPLDGPEQESLELSRWSDTFLFWGATVGAALGAPLAVWSPTLVENQRMEVGGSFYGLGSTSTLELLLGGTLFGALGGIVVVLLAFVARNTWRAVAR